jgi:hypothetical protein
MSIGISFPELNVTFPCTSFLIEYGGKLGFIPPGINEGPESDRLPFYPYYKTK